MHDGLFNKSLAVFQNDLQTSILRFQHLLYTTNNNDHYHAPCLWVFRQ